MIAISTFSIWSAFPVILDVIRLKSMHEIGDLFVVLLVAFCAFAGIPVAHMNRKDQPRGAAIMLVAAILLAFGFAITNFGLRPVAVIGAITVSFLMVLGYFNVVRRLSDEPDDIADK